MGEGQLDAPELAWRDSWLQLDASSSRALAIVVSPLAVVVNNVHTKDALAIDGEGPRACAPKCRCGVPD